MRGINRALGGSAIALLWAAVSWAQTAPPPEPAPAEDGLSAEAFLAPEPPTAPEASGPAPTISDAIAAGKLILEVRPRHEGVDQVGIANQATAYTVRTRLGWETADWHGLKALIEFEDVRHLGAEDYNVAVPGPGGVSLNGKTSYPIVNDPDVTELNRLQLSWMPNAAFGLVLGRQRILLDDQRFIGNVGWRQDEQTFDAARLDLAFGRVKATYVYLDHVNRILGEEKDWRSDSHLLNVAWAVAEPLKLQGFVYALDFENAKANSSLTTGAKVSGKVWLSLVQVAYSATWARETDHGFSPLNFSLDYAAVDIAGTFDIYTARAGYEVLEGNGAVGFFTPLATVHAFQGWSDAFVTAGGNKTHVDGIKDFNLSLTVRPRFKFKYLYNTEFLVRWHDFEAERTGAQLASEWDVQATAAVTPKLSILIKYADFDRDTPVPGTTPAPASRTKVWVGFEYKL